MTELKRVGDAITWAFPGGFVLNRGVVRSVTEYGYTAYHEDSPPGRFRTNPDFHYHVHKHQVVS